MKIVTLWLLNLQVFFCYSLETDCRKEPRCGISRVHKMKTANCYDRQFKYFPKCLNTDVEVIELSFNRIRRITRKDISKFKYLKHLYLADNLITNLDADIFDDVDLATLDLSLNAITKIPTSIFHLPSLKSLYLGQNWNINIADAVENSKPILSPLTQIDISQTTEEENYGEFPNFGILPFLAMLKINSNFYFTLTPNLFMGLCNLQKLINDNVTTLFEDPCDCWKVNYWLKNKNVTFTSFTCTVLQTKCTYDDFKEEDLKIYKQCKEKFETIKRNSLIANLCIGIGATVATIVLAIILICIWRRRKHSNAKNKTQKEENCIDDASPLNTQEKSVQNVYSL